MSFLAKESLYILFVTLPVLLKLRDHPGLDCVASVSVGLGSEERPRDGIFGVSRKWGESHG